MGTPLQSGPGEISPTNTPDSVAVVVTATGAPSPVSAIPVAAGQANLTIYYDSQSLFIHNSANRQLKLDGLKVGRLSISAWSSIAPLPARGLPIGNCLGVSVVAITDPTPPEVCKHVWALLNVSPTRAFWATASFDVTLNGLTLQTCAVADKQCGVKLP